MVVKSLLAYRHNVAAVRDFNAFAENTSKILDNPESSQECCSLSVRSHKTGFMGREGGGIRSLLEKNLLLLLWTSPMSRTNSFTTNRTAKDTEGRKTPATQTGP